MELSSGLGNEPSHDSGIMINRGSKDNAFIGWNEQSDKFSFGTTDASGGSTGSINITKSTVLADLEGNVTGVLQFLPNV